MLPGRQHSQSFGTQGGRTESKEVFMFVRIVLPFAVVLLSAAAGPAQDTRKELEKLQGEWTMVSMETKGMKARDDVVKQYKLTIKGDQWTVTTLKGVGGKATFKID